MHKTPGKSQSADTLDLANDLHSAAIHLLRKLRTVDAQTKLTAPKLSALSVIVFAGPIPLGHLAQSEQVTPPTITRLVRDLESEGLVKRVPSRDDRRITLVQATAAGKKRLHAGRLRRVSELADWVHKLPRQDRAAIARAVTILESFTRNNTEQ